LTPKHEEHQMAKEHQIGNVTVKEQNIWAWLGLAFITLGIYVYFWTYRVNREMRDVGKAYNEPILSQGKPGMTVLAMFIPIANLIAIHRTGTRIIRMQAITAQPPTYSMATHWLLAIFTGLWPMYAQSALNATWHYAQIQQAGSAPLEPATPASPIAVNH
jgi:hypothetical protein